MELPHNQAEGRQESNKTSGQNKLSAVEAGSRLFWGSIVKINPETQTLHASGSSARPQKAATVRRKEGRLAQIIDCTLPSKE